MITREYLANYPYLQQVIERDKKKLQRLKDNPPVNQVSVVRGSSKHYPYLPQNFHVAEPDIRDSKDWELRVRQQEVQIQSNIKLLEQVVFEIDELIETIKNPRDKLVFEYLYHDGMSQQQVADKMFMDRSNVSKIVDKYVKN